MRERTQLPKTIALTKVLAEVGTTGGTGSCDRAEK